MKYTLVIMTLVLSACGANHEYSSPDGNSADGAPPAKTIGFVAVSQMFQRNQCLQCHSSAGGNRAGINLETIKGTKGFIASIQDQINRNVMPPKGPPVGPDDRSILSAWVQAGMPEESALPLPGQMGR